MLNHKIEPWCKLWVSGYYNHYATRQGTSDGLVSLTPHDEMMSHSQGFKAFQVARKMPWELVIFPNAALFVHGDYQGEDQTATCALMWGCAW